MSYVYPNEVWPVDTSVEDLDGTTDSRTGLPYIAKGTNPASMPSYEVQYNRRLYRQNAILAIMRQGMVVDEGNLRIGVYPLDYMLGGVRKSFAGASGLSVSDNSNYVVYLDSNGLLQLAGAWPGEVATFLPLASVTASSGVLQIGDERGFAAFHVPSIHADDVCDDRIVTAYRSNVGPGESNLKVFAFAAPWDVTLMAVQVYCGSVTGMVAVDVMQEGVSMLSSPAVPVAGSVVQPILSEQNIISGNDLTVHATTDGTGGLSDLSVTLLVEATGL